MKPDNLLVFRSQEVKLGDLGISVKLDPKDTAGTQAKYYGKGKTNGFTTSSYDNSLMLGDTLSKNEMFECDVFAIKVTFKRAIDKV